LLGTRTQPPPRLSAATAGHRPARHCLLNTRRLLSTGHQPRVERLAVARSCVPHACQRLTAACLCAAAVAVAVALKNWLLLTLARRFSVEWASGAGWRDRQAAWMPLTSLQGWIHGASRNPAPVVHPRTRRRAAPAPAPPAPNPAIAAIAATASRNLNPTASPRPRNTPVKPCSRPPPPLP